MPANRLMASACPVSNTTAAISTGICHRCGISPSEMISVVAPAGGCGTRRRTIAPLVAPSDSAAAPTRGQSTPADRAGAAAVNGQALPPHRHGTSDLMLFVVEGRGELQTDADVQRFEAGSIAFYRGDEELRVRNTGDAGMTLLAFLSPKFATG